MFVLEILGRPIPCQRPRLRGKFFFDPQVFKKNFIRSLLKEKFNREPVESAVKVFFEFHFKVPKNISNDKRKNLIDSESFFNKRPDLSNLIKFYEDTGNGYLWKDDAQIVEIVSKKIYGEVEKTTIKIEEVEER